jgi:septal ring-binding cell division protein DamX
MLFEELGVGPACDSKAEYLLTLNQYLIDKLAANERVLLIVDEAQNLSPEMLEEIRLLSNLESNRHKLLHIVLFGQPELDEHLALANMRQIKERIIHSFKLEPLVRDDITQYIEFRMRAAGYKGPSIFTSAALKIISQASEGLTRRVNILADKSLLAAFADGTHQITVKHARAAVRDSEFRRMTKVRSVWAIAAVGAAAGLLMGLFFHYFSAPQSAPFTGAVVTAAPAIPASPQQAESKPPTDTVSTPAMSTTESSTTDTLTKGSEQALTSAGTSKEMADSPHAPQPASVGPAETKAPARAPAPAGGASTSTQTAIASTPPAASSAPANAKAPARTMLSAASPSAAPAATPDTPAAPTPAGASAPAQPVVNTPVLAPEGELASARFAATQEWLKTAPDKKYAIELLTVRRGKGDILEDFVRQLGQLLDADSVYVYSVKIEGSQYYAVAYGNYGSVADTVTAMGQLPETLKARAPYPRSFGRMRAQNQQ